ncbi:MAG: DNA primase catalytic subunit PriS [Candidatus Micrarchaeota archaeon]
MDSGGGLHAREKAFAQEAFKEYYRRHLKAPPQIYAREFGFGFEKKIDFRHRAFETETALQEFIQREAPLYMSYSAAYYRYPAAQPMQNKEFLGADLVFDLDAQTAHEAHNPVFCHECFEGVRKECIELVDEFLLHDFGFPAEELRVNFSGQKGFHIHVRSERVRSLSAEARRQLINYATAGGLNLAKILARQKRASDSGRAVEVLRGPTENSKGWAGKLYRAATGLIGRGDAEEMRAIGLTRPQMQKLAENREAVLGKMRQGNWDYLRGMEKAWENLLQRTVKMHGVEVDRNVTYDLARLIRLPDSLHGDTGFIAKTMKMPELAVFDPTRDATAFDDRKPVRVTATEAVNFGFAGKTVDLKAHEQRTLPFNVAMLLVCKKKAALV